MIRLKLIGLDADTRTEIREPYINDWSIERIKFYEDNGFDIRFKGEDTLIKTKDESKYYTTKSVEGYTRLSSLEFKKQIKYNPDDKIIGYVNCVDKFKRTRDAIPVYFKCTPQDTSSNCIDEILKRLL